MKSHSKTKKSKPLIGLDLEALDAQIETCEKRLALSASLAGDLLLNALDVQPDIQSQSTVDPADNPATASPADSASHPDLVEQAVQLHQSDNLDGSGQTVAVIDSGVAWDHVALGGGYGPGYRVVGGWDFAENDANPYDDGPVGFHGTHVAGLLGGNGQGVQGIAPGADIVGLRVFDDYGESELAWIESALQWVHENQDSFESPITTVNLSIGAALSDSNRLEATSMLADELQLLREDNILVFAAAGNFYGTDQASGDNQILFPASDPNVVAISSVDQGGSLSDFAQREPGILAARGEAIESSVPDHIHGWDGNVNDLATLDGTSMATPQAAGASVLIRQALMERGVEPTADEILTRLEQSSRMQTDPGTGETFHTIDLAAAIESFTPDATELDSQTTNAQLILDDAPLDHFHGDDNSASYTLDLSDGVKLHVGDRSYTLLQKDASDPLVIDVGGGADSIHIIGSENSERLMARPSIHGNEVSELSTNEMTFQLRGFEELTFDGGGGHDRATLYDSEGDDTSTASNGQVTLEGVGFRFEVNQVPRTYVHATEGGDDTAFLFDSEGNDTLTARPQFSSLRSESEFRLAYGFETVYAFSNAGGDDIAKIYDSEDDDVLSVSAASSLIKGADYQVSARGFSSIIAQASAGGDDTANIYASDAGSNWTHTSDMVQWTGDDNAVRVARGFERNHAFEEFQPISLQPLSISSFSGDDEREELANREADAARSIFEQFGRE